MSMNSRLAWHCGYNHGSIVRSGSEENWGISESWQQAMSDFAIPNEWQAYVNGYNTGFSGAPYINPEA